MYKQKSYSTISVHGIDKNCTSGNQVELLFYLINQEFTGKKRRNYYLCCTPDKIINQLYCKCRKRFKRITNRDHNQVIRINLLDM